MQGWSKKDPQHRDATKVNLITALQQAELSSLYDSVLRRYSAATAGGGRKSIAPQQQQTSAKGSHSKRSGCGQQARTVIGEHLGTSILRLLGKSQQESERQQQQHSTTHGTAPGHYAQGWHSTQYNQEQQGNLGHKAVQTRTTTLEKPSGFTAHGPPYALCPSRY